MTARDDSYSEMGRFGRISEHDIERLLGAGSSGDPALGDLAAALREAREQLTGPPDETTRRSHLLALAAAIEDLDAEASPSVSSPAKRRPTLGRRLMRRAWLIGTRVAAAGGALALSTLGLAYAGVDLPGTAAEQAWEVAGVQLPNQGDVPEESKADDVQAVIDASEDKGCEFGQSVSEAASQGSERQGPSEDPCGGGDAAEGRNATGDEKSAEGRAKAAERSDGRSEAGADNAGAHDDGGGATASEKSDGKSDAGSDNAGGESATGEREAAGSSDVGEGAASEGSGNADNGSETGSEKSGGSKPDTPSGP
jgi:hypothetical protein